MTHEADYYRSVAERMPPGTVVNPTAGSNTYAHDRFDYAPPSRSSPSRFSWLLGVVVMAAVTAGLDWAAARWEHTATVPLGFPGGAVLDFETKRGWSGIPYERRARPHTGRQEGRR